MLLALDLSLTETGYCIFNANGLYVTGGVIKTKLRDTDRLYYIKNNINALLVKHKIKHAIIENYAYAARGQVFNIGELGGVIKLLLFESDINIITVPPTTLKKFVTGKGNAKKELMLKYVYKKFKFDTDNNNICDAFALGKYWFSISGKK